MGTRQERCMAALDHTRELFEQALGAWFGSAGSALRVTGYEDLKLFVDATSRSFSLRLKKKGFDEEIPRSQVSEGLLELLRKKLVEEEEALAADEWEKVMYFLDKFLEAEVEKAKERLRAKRGVLEMRMARASSCDGGAEGYEGVVVGQCAMLRKAVDEQQEALSARVEARKERVQAHIDRNLGFAESALRRAEEVLEGAASLLSATEDGGGGGVGGGGDERVLCEAGRVMGELDEVAGGPGAETLLMPSAFDPVKVLGHTQNLDMSEQISACASMQLGGVPSHLQAPVPAPTTQLWPHAPDFGEEEQTGTHKATPGAAGSAPSDACTPTASLHEAAHQEGGSQRAPEAPAANEEAALWVPKFEVSFEGAALLSSEASPAVLPHLPPPPNSRRGRGGAADGGADLIDLSDPVPDAAGADKKEWGGDEGEMDDLDRAVDLLGAGEEGAGGGDVDVDDILENVGAAL